MSTFSSRVYQGRDVIINIDIQQVQVQHVVGLLWRKQAEWRVVPLSHLVLNMCYPQSVGMQGRRFSIADLPLTLRDISEALGVQRLDGDSAARIWGSPDVVKGRFLAIDFALREVAFKPSVYVLPFTGIAGVIAGNPPYLQYKYHAGSMGRHPATDIRLNGAELAKKLNVPLLQAETE